MKEVTWARSELRAVGHLCALTLILSATGIAALTQTAHAHLGSKKNVRAELLSDGVLATFEVEAVDASLAVGLGLEADPGTLMARSALIARWLSAGVNVTGAGEPCTAAPGAPHASSRDGIDTVVVRVAYICEAGSPYVLSDQTVFDTDPDHATVVEVMDGDSHAVHVLSSERRSVELVAAPSAAATAIEMVVEGAIHLVTGYDHLLFLLTLLLAGGVVSKKRGLRVAGREVAWVVTAFTLGHSVSLALATFGVVTLPPRWVESAIAATIVVVALDNVLRPERSGARPALSGVFGLVHGFGFASVLAEVGLPASQRALALFSFNVGIELAQLSFVVVLLAPLAWLASKKLYEPVVLRGGSFAIAAMGAVWLVERAVLGV